MESSRSAGDESAQSREPPSTPARRFRRTGVIATCASLLVAGGVAIGFAVTRSQPAPAAASAPAPAPVKSPTSTTVDPPRHVTAPAPAHHQPPDVTVVARMRGTFQGYFRPGGAKKVLVTETWETEPSTLPVIATMPGWLEVRLPERPDEDTAWIRASDAILSTTPFRIVIDLKTTHLELFKRNREIMDVPAGVGATYTPTPTGDFFFAFFEPPIGPEYGAFIMVTSAHSRAIESFAGTGDAIIAIHGPIGADAEIGTTGAYISNGCIRLHDNDLLRLSDVPPGTPIQIID
jgi:lipoprotein-anchoring transpeptidase ErfK/SrfK